MKIPVLFSLVFAFLLPAAAEVLMPLTEGFRSAVKQEPFEVQGNSIAALVADMKAKGPVTSEGEKFFAKTDWNLHWNYRWKPTGSHFVITTLTVTADIAYHMPKRILPPDEPDRVAERWARFIAALSAHEQGHAQNALNHGKALYDVLRAPRVFPSTEALKNFVQTEGDKCIAEAKAADKEYDQRTGHGATQGATLR